MMIPAPETAAAQPKPKADPFADWALWVKDNVEAFVIAFIIALVVRCFCLEVFKIPTGSMTPTLLGDHNVGEVPVGGDRIMVSKFMYHLFPPHRFDVVVFKFPLDTSRNFIKRLVGLPNEKLLVQQGDLYACPDGQKEFHIARKPLRVQESMWMPVFPSEKGGLKDSWEPLPPDATTFDAESVVIDSKGVPGDDVTLGYKRRVFDSYEPYSHGGGGQEVGDLRLAGTITWLGGEGGVTLRIRSEPDWVEAWLPASGKGNLLWQKGGGAKKEAPFDAPIGDGKPHDVALLNYDGLAHLRIDGQMVAELSYREVFAPLSKGESGASFILHAGKASIEHVTLHRDVFYLDGGPGSALYPEETPIQIPGHCYFMMGDNSPNSKDSRLWSLKVIKRKEGGEIRADTSNVHYTADTYDVRDIYGVEYHIKRADMQGPPETAPKNDAVFVQEDLIVGKAFYLWWPTDRMKLIR